ncbi:hypothetical protein AWB97_10115 [Mycobacterium intracellulare subsp. chimaera]|nr:hypothetical protein AWB97_10115 [Mycobacterium intracellulare subsp. chimaera]
MDDSDEHVGSDAVLLVDVPPGFDGLVDRAAVQFYGAVKTKRWYVFANRVVDRFDEFIVCGFFRFQPFPLGLFFGENTSIFVVEPLAFCVVP